MSKEHYRENLESEWHEWSTDTTDGILRGKPSRMFLRVDMSEMVTLSEDLVTSDSPEARELGTPHLRELCFGKLDAVWLQKALTELCIRKGWLEADDFVPDGFEAADVIVLPDEDYTVSGVASESEVGS